MTNNLIQIDKSILKNYNIKLTEYLFLIILTYYPKSNISININNLIENRFIIESDVGYLITDKGLKAIKEVERLSISKEQVNIDISQLAEQMKLLFPEGKKFGTNKYWRDNKSNVENKLQTFFKKYGHYDSDLILQATQKYVESFGDNKQLMRTIIYFILKEDSSDLLTTIENLDSISNNSNDDMWTSSIK